MLHEHDIRHIWQLNTESNCNLESYIMKMLWQPFKCTLQDNGYGKEKHYIQAINLGLGHSNWYKNTVTNNNGMTHLHIILGMVYFGKYTPKLPCWNGKLIVKSINVRVSQDVGPKSSKKRMSGRKINDKSWHIKNRPQGSIKSKDTGRTSGKPDRNIDSNVTNNTREDRPIHKTNHKDKTQLERAGRNTRAAGEQSFNHTGGTR